ncbi:MAG: MerR family transcriptional regulator [Bacteroidales bacterium]|jgi:DNA-binding transcriptional MerR regulator|nr:MerR family transcriptional regulator [Bacteroidales bacterium]MBQ4012748.1 MerR family transcriptional regulator [Bacteroidales bacterium]
MAEKLYYKIGEVAAMLGEEVSTIRFWSDTFPRYIKPERNAKGNRLFHPEDVENIRLIHYLTRVEGLTLDGAARKLDENRDGLDHKRQIVEKLYAIRSQLSEIYESI